MRREPQSPADDKIRRTVEWLGKHKDRKGLHHLLVETADKDAIYNFCCILTVLEEKNLIILKGN